MAPQRPAVVPIVGVGADFIYHVVKPVVIDNVPASGRSRIRAVRGGGNDGVGPFGQIEKVGSVRHTDLAVGPVVSVIGQIPGVAHLIQIRGADVDPFPPGGIFIENAAAFGKMHSIGRGGQSDGASFVASAALINQIKGAVIQIDPGKAGHGIIPFARAGAEHTTIIGKVDSIGRFSQSNAHLSIDVGTDIIRPNLLAHPDKIGKMHVEAAADTGVDRVLLLVYLPCPKSA